MARLRFMVGQKLDVSFARDRRRVVLSLSVIIACCVLSLTAVETRTDIGTPHPTCPDLDSQLCANEYVDVPDYVYSDDSEVRFGVTCFGGGTCYVTVFFDGQYQYFSGAPSGARLYMQGDGNLTVLDSSFDPVWSSGTDGNSGAWVNVQNDGNVVIYTAGGTPIWSTNTFR